MLLKQKVIYAYKWSALGEVTSRMIGPLVFIVLARLLVPEDFGVAAAATVLISFSQVFSDVGLAKALIQRQDRVEESANIVFWLNLGIGIAIVAILLVGAPLIAWFFHDERIAPVIRVLSLQILLTAFSTVHTSLLKKALNFKPLFWVRLVTTTIPGLASIPLAIYGMGYWALVAGTLIGQAVQSAALWMCNSWRPRWTFDLDLASKLVSFGKWAMLSGVLGWFYLWMDAIIVGHYLGSHDMGLYRTGNTFVIMIFGLIFSPLVPIIYSIISKIQSDLKKVSDLLFNLVKGIAIVTFPVSAGIIALRLPIEQHFFGIQWNGISIVIAILALTHGFAWLVGFNGELYRGIGKPHIETWVMALSLPVYLIFYLIAVQYGLFVFLYSRLIVVFIGLIAHLIVSGKLLSFGFKKFFNAVHRSFIITSFVLLFFIFFLDTSPHGLLLVLLRFFFVLSLCSILIILAEQGYVKKMYMLFTRC
jgi:PST family polysaccharide transporter